MQAEFNAPIKIKTWDLVPYTGQENMVGSKWVFKIKYNANRSVQRYKARLEAKGCQQDLGLDFGETYSLVIKAPTIRLILIIVVQLNREIRQFDINNSFLNGFLVRLSTFHNHNDLKTKQSLIMCADSEKRYMG